MSIGYYIACSSTVRSGMRLVDQGAGAISQGPCMNGYAAQQEKFPLLYGLLKVHKPGTPLIKANCLLCQLFNIPAVQAPHLHPGTTGW